jgi:hypothetical protein
MAILVPKIMAPPNPWRARTAMRRPVEGTIVMTRDAKEKIAMPDKKTRFLPYMSAIFPMGTRKRAAARRYAVAIQESEMASMWNSAPIAGSAILTADPSNGVRKPARMAINSTICLPVGVTATSGVWQIAGTSGVVSIVRFGFTRITGIVYQVLLRYQQKKYFYIV